MAYYLEWCEEKNNVNKKEHQISFETASILFKDPLKISIKGTSINNQTMWRTIGKIKNDVIIIVLCNVSIDEKDDEIIQILSARSVTKKEREKYEHG